MNSILRAGAGFLLVFAVHHAAAETASSCVTCHEKEAAAEQHAAHRLAGIRCVDCHGGDAGKKEKAASKAEGTGYLGEIERVKIPELCGNCHSDVRRMNPYGLPTDQLAQYKASHHGELLYEDGDDEVAVCSDCHHAHGTRSARDPRSAVYPKNVAATCGKCHSDAELMGDRGLSAKQEKKYRESVHAEMLYEKGDLSAPTCVTCHGNHGAVPPGFARVGLVCGKCHIKQKEYFDKGPHGKPAEEGDFETCVTCHSNHKIVEPSNAIYRRCKTCHDEEDAEDQAYPTMKRITKLLDLTRNHYAEVAKKLDETTRAGFHLDDEHLILDEARTYVMQLAPLQHDLNVEEISEVSSQAMEVVDRVDARIDGKLKAARWRKLSLIPIGIFLLLMSIGFRLKLRAIQRGKE